MPDNCQSLSDSDYPSHVRVGEPVGKPARWGSPMGRGINLLSARFVDIASKHSAYSVEDEAMLKWVKSHL